MEKWRFGLVVRDAAHSVGARPESLISAYSAEQRSLSMAMLGGRQW